MKAPIFTGSMRLTILCGALAATSALSAPAEWPVWRGSQNLRGVAQGTPPSAPALRWQFKTAGPVRSSAVISGRAAFIGSDDSRVYSIGLADGKKLWDFQTGGPVEAPPLVVGPTVYVGSDDGLMYALDAGTGALRWKHETGGKIAGAANYAPLRGAGTNTPGRTAIIFGSYDNKLHAVDAETGKRLWTVETTSYINGAPAVGNGRVVFGACDARVRVVSANDGRPLTDITAGSYVPGSVALSGTRAYLGHFGNQVLCVDVALGTNIWSYQVADTPFFSSPAVNDGRLVIGGRDKALHCIGQNDGKRLWRFQAGGNFDSSPVICGDKVIAGCDDGRLYMVSLRDGREIWSYEIGGSIESSAAVSDGLIVIGSSDGSVYAFGGPP